MSIWRAFRHGRPPSFTGEGHRPTRIPTSTEKPPAPPAGPAGVSPSFAYEEKIIGIQQPAGSLPVEAQILLRIMGEDLDTARELIKAMRPVDRAVFAFYLVEAGFLADEINREDGRL